MSDITGCETFSGQQATEASLAHQCITFQALVVKLFVLVTGNTKSIMFGNIQGQWVCRMCDVILSYKQHIVIVSMTS